MKLTSIIKKNFKLLIRAKASAFIILIGPLLIVLLVGLVFSGKSSYELSLGYYAPIHNNLTDLFIESLKQSHYYVQEFRDEQGCVKKIEQGLIHTCIIFPKDFQISNEQSNELRFLVDYSRMNLVYKIIDSVSGILEVESKELSYSLTQVLLSKINATIKDVDGDLMLLGELNPKINLLMLDLQRAKANTEAMKFDIEDIAVVGLNTQISSINETITQVQEKGLELINKSEQWLEELFEDSIEDILEDENSTYYEEAEIFDELRTELLDLYNTTPEKIQDLINAVGDISDSLSELELRMNNNEKLNKDTKEKIESAKNNLADIQGSLIDLKNALEKSKQNLEGISITQAETIVSPVNTKIEPIVSETLKQTFMFPFLLVLVIMFVALLLSSTLIMFEKNSKAFFRNFVTPTNPAFFVTTTFITSFIVIVLQTLLILGLANYFLHIPLFKNVLFTLPIVFVTTTFFIVLGMTIGYLFSTQEGAIMSSIVLGSVFMFLSNLVVPLETLAPALSGIIRYNPYVLASELLRKSLLFKVNIQEVWLQILILFGASLIIFLLMILLHSLSRKRRIREPQDIVEARVMQQKHMASKPEIKAAKGGLRAANKLHLLKQVSDMTKAEFEDNVNLGQNKIAAWVEKKLGDKKLAYRLRKTLSKKEIMRIIAEDIKKERKKEK